MVDADVWAMIPTIETNTIILRILIGKLHENGGITALSKNKGLTIRFREIRTILQFFLDELCFLGIYEDFPSTIFVIFEN